MLERNRGGDWDLLGEAQKVGLLRHNATRHLSGLGFTQFGVFFLRGKVLIRGYVLQGS